MATKKVRPIPEGAHSLTPHLVCAGAARAIGFYVRAFGAVEEFRLAGPDGKLAHACVRIGDSQLMLVDEFPGNPSPKALNGSPVVIHHFVEDVDAVVKQAVEAGATVIMPPADMFWGDRYAQIADPFGHRWSIATHVRDLTPEQIVEGMSSAG
jgi:PhnB protein